MGIVQKETQRGVEFGPGAITRAIGDSITVIPLVVALALLTDVSLPHVLAAFGVFQVVWGVRYGLPVSVEPMKALAALATSLLFSDLLDADVTPDELSTSMGVTNLLAIPVGGIPMCHGCDGVAGKHAFGARTGGANVVLGAGYLAAALFATPALLGAFLVAMLGALLAIVALSLARNALDSSNVAISLGIGAVTLATNLGVAFLLGIGVHLAWERLDGSSDA